MKTQRHSPCQVCSFAIVATAASYCILCVFSISTVARYTLIDKGKRMHEVTQDVTLSVLAHSFIQCT